MYDTKIRKCISYLLASSSQQQIKQLLIFSAITLSPIKVHVKKFTEVLGSIQLQEKVLVSDTFNLLNLCTKMKDADIVVLFLYLW